MKIVRRAMLAAALVAAATALGLALRSVPVVGAEPEPAGQIEIKTVSSVESFKEAVAKHKGKIVLVDFWATWCGPCVERLPHNAEIIKKFGPKGVVVIAMSLDETGELVAVKKRLTDTPLPGVVFMMDDGDDDTFEKVERYDVGPLPHFNLYDRSGTLVKEFESGNPDAVFTSDDIDAAIQGLLDKEKP